MKSNKNIYDLFFKFIFNNIKIIILLIIIPQIAIFTYTYSSVNNSCIGVTKINVSRSVSNLKIVPEIFIENLDLEELDNVILSDLNIIIKGDSKEKCKKTYNILRNKTKKSNKYIEEFYRSILNETERSRFSGPILFNTIGGHKIQFARLSGLDLEKLKKRDAAYSTIYTFIGSIIIIILYFFLMNYRKFKKLL